MTAIARIFGGFTTVVLFYGNNGASHDVSVYSIDDRLPIHQLFTDTIEEAREAWAKWQAELAREGLRAVDTVRGPEAIDVLFALYPFTDSERAAAMGAR